MTQIAIRDGDRASFVYLLGIKPEKEIRIGPNVTICAVQADPNPNDMIQSIMSENASCSEVDLGILISTLRLTTAEMEVTAEDSKSLAINTWNAQIDLTLLSALTSHEIYWSIQSSTSASSFSSTSTINAILQSRLYLPIDVKTLSINECNWLNDIFPRAQNLMSLPAFETAVNSLWSFRMHLRTSSRLAVLWMGIESLFDVQSELRFRVSLLAAKFLEGGSELQRSIKELYAARSKAVHAGKTSDDTVVDETADLLHRLILKCVEVGGLPNERQLLFGE